MKSILKISAVILLLFALPTKAQVSLSINIGARPDWCGHYYEDRVQYVYLPELECYYDNYEEVYVYYGPSGWCRSRYLPDYCNGYDINRAYRVVIDYRGNAPWANFDYHRNYYWRNHYRNYRQEYYGPNYNRRGNYVAVSDRRYYKNYDNDRYQRRGNGNAYGHYKRENDYDRGNREDNPGRGHGRR